MDSHPDKVGGSGEQFQDMTALRDALKDPDHFQIYKLLHNMTALTPFDGEQLCNTLVGFAGRVVRPESSWAHRTHSGAQSGGR